MLIVKKIKFLDEPSLDMVSETLDSLEEKQYLNYINWQQFPYKPLVYFKIAYDDSHIYLKYYVTEKSSKAKYTIDNDRVWTDSCVEFFFSPDNYGSYYNLEINCIGTILLGYRNFLNEKVHAPKEILSLIKRKSSLGNQAFEEISLESEWTITVIVPIKAFFNHDNIILKGQTRKANFYKCGDELHEPHFVSWAPIHSDKPNFHLPEFFGKIFFEG